MNSKSYKKTGIVSGSVIDSNLLSTGAKFAYVVLTTQADITHRSSITTKELGDKLGRSISTTNRYLNELKNTNIISIDKQGNRKGIVLMNRTDIPSELMNSCYPDK